jgi:hypothetical protein
MDSIDRKPDRKFTFIKDDLKMRSPKCNQPELPSLTRERVIDELQNPYPKSVFVSISEENIEAVVKLLKDNGYSSDALFGWWGRQVWNNCVDKVSNVIDALTEPERCDNSKLYPCPYSTAVTCVLTDPCMGCETFSRYLAGEEIPRFKSVDPNIKDTNVLNPDVNKIDITEQFPDTSKNAKQFKSVEPEKEDLPVFDKQYLDECIERATPNLSKLGKLDESVEPEMTAEEGDKISKRRNNSTLSTIDCYIRLTGDTLFEEMTDDDLDSIYTVAFGHWAYHLSRQGYINALNKRRLDKK